MGKTPELLKSNLIGETIKRDLKGKFLKNNNEPRPWLRKIPDIQKEVVENLYLKDQKSLSQVSKYYKCNLETVRKFCIKHAIKIRTPEEGTRLIANSEDLRKKRSENMTGIKNHRFGKPAAYGCGFGRVGIRKDLDQYFRSSWEANIARLLNYYQIKWKYEPQTFILGNLSYTPDFLIENQIYLEVKGKYFVNAFEKIKRFRNKYPDKKYLLIDSKIYRQLERVYHPIVPNWEYR